MFMLSTPPKKLNENLRMHIQPLTWVASLIIVFYSSINYAHNNPIVIKFPNYPTILTHPIPITTGEKKSNSLNNSNCENGIQTVILIRASWLVKKFLLN